MATFDRRTMLRLAALGGVAAAGVTTAQAAGPTRASAPRTPTYLTGVLAPVPDEIDGRNLTVEGTIPPELSGRYFRNGPNPRPGVDPGVWWAGSGMIHGVRLSQGRAEWYRNRWVKTVDLPEGTPDLRRSTANTSVIRHSGKILALYEVSYPYEITPELQTVGPCDFGGRLTTAMTAHPKLDPITGELHLFGYSPQLTYHRLSPAGELIHSVPIDLPEVVMMHDFAITEHYVLWLDLPVVWDAEALRNGFPRWSDTHQPRIGVMPRDGRSDDIRWFTVDPRWAFHVGNAHEDHRGRIILDAISGDHRAWRDIERYFTGHPGGANVGYLHRWTLDPATGRAAEETLDDLGTEFPTINDHQTGLNYRYLYSTTTPGAPTRHHRIVKHDLRNGTSQAHHLGRHRVAGEAVFIPAKNARNEDDGWLMTIAHDLFRPASALLLLDATTPAAPPVATIHLPRRIPCGAHGDWFPDTP